MTTAICTAQLGDATISIDLVEYTHRNSEEGGDWLIGKMHLSWDAALGGRLVRQEAEIQTGCWSDTDDDCAEWCADNEGARAINALLGVPDDGDTRGTLTRMAWPDQCASLGRAICRAIRSSAEDAQ